MRFLNRLAVCSAFLAVCSSFALADSVSVTGNVSFTPSSLTFAPPFATQTDTGIFGQFSNGTVNYLLGTVAYTNGLPATVEAFTIMEGGDVLVFYDQVNSPSQTYDALGNLDVTLDETGYYTFNGGAGIAGTFDLSFRGNSPNGSDADVPFLGTGALTGPIPLPAGVTPEPKSFLLMGTGFLALAGLARRRRHPLEAMAR